MDNRRKRKFIQFFSILIYNADVKNWFSGSISHAATKRVCVPGLNCYSCPGAVASCPLGSIQTTIANGRFPLFITGFLLLIGTLIGRAVCAFLCPVGLVQELLYKIPFPKVKRTPKAIQMSQKLSQAKYFFLVLTIVIPLISYFSQGFGSPFFCKFICPAGTVSAGWPLVALNEELRETIGFLFSWKSILAVIFILLSLSIFRPFCKFFCPLGAIYSFFNKVAIFGIKVKEENCTHCGACTANCKMNAKTVNDPNCIRCNECLDTCKFNALFIQKLSSDKLNGELDKDRI